MNATSLLSISLTLSLAAATSNAQSLSIIAETGGSTPLSGTTFAEVGDGQLTEAGTVTFWSRITGPDVTTENDAIWWSSRSGELRSVVREGATLDGATIVAIPSLSINDDLVGLLAASLVDASTGFNTNLALAFSAPGTGGETGVLTLIARDPVSPARFDLPGRPTNPPGTDVFWTQGNLIRGLNGVIADSNSAVPQVEQLGGDSTWRFVGFGMPSRNGIGALSFWASTGTNQAQSPTFDVLRKGIWTTRDGTLELLAGEGTQVGGAPSGQVYADVGARPRTLADGSILFRAKVRGPGVGSSNDSSLIVITPNGQTRGIVDAGQEYFTGLPERFGTIPESFSANARGEVVFAGSVREAAPGRGLVIIHASMSGVREVARSGDPAPGLDGGETLRTFQHPFINEAGRVAFIASVQSSNATFARQALYATSRTGDLRLITVEGSSLVAQGGLKTISRIIFQHEAGGVGQTAYTRADQLIFGVEFADGGEAVIVANVDCLADFDLDGDVDSDDTINFFTAWDAAEISADIDRSGGVDGEDVILFFERWDRGC